MSGGDFHTVVDFSLVALIAFAGSWGLLKLKAVVQFFSRLNGLTQDWTGIPDRPGVPGHRGVMERVYKIEGEVTPNGGGSIKDAVRRIEASLTTHIEEQRVIADEWQRWRTNTDDALHAKDVLDATNVQDAKDDRADKSHQE